MKASKWLWRSLVAIGVLVALVAWLARPSDPYAVLQRLSHREMNGEYSVSTSAILPGGPKQTDEETYATRTYVFMVPVARVEAILPPHTMTSGSVEHFTFSNGDEGELARPGDDGDIPLDTGETCAVTAYVSQKPWLLRSWINLKLRLGL